MVGQTTNNALKIKKLKNTFVNRFLFSLILFLIPSLLGSLSRIFEFGWQSIHTIHIILAILLIIPLALRNKLSNKFKTHLISIILTLIAAFSAIHFGINGTVFFFALPLILITLLYGYKKALIYAIPYTIFMIVIMFLYIHKILEPAFDLYLYNEKYTSWISYIIGLIWIFIMTIYTIEYFYKVHTLSLNKLEQYSSQLVKQNTELQDKFNKLPLAIGISNKAGKIIFVNKKFEKLFGYTKKDLPDFETWTNNAYPDPHYRKKVVKIWEADIKNFWENNIEPPARDYIMKCRNGEYKNIELSFSFEGDELIVSFNDITERIKMQTETKEQQLFIEKITEQTPDVIFIHNLISNSFTYLNKNITRILGYEGITEKADIFNFLRQIIHPDDKKLYPDYMNIIHNRKEFYESQFEFRLKTNNGAWKWFAVHEKEFQRDENNKIVSIIGNFSDISYYKKTEAELKRHDAELKRKNEEYIAVNEELRESNEKILTINQQLTKAKNKAEESDKLKTAFLHNMSHEIRTPMNGIIGFSDLLAESDLEEEKKTIYVEQIRKNSNQLLSIVNNIIDISLLETNQIDLSEDKIHIYSLLKDIFLLFQTKNQSEHLKLIYLNNDKPDELVIKTDKSKLMQIMSNLIGNAVKFTEKGIIKIGYSIFKDYIIIEVQDSGQAIPVDERKNIFKYFRQIESNTTRKFGGTGLGLSICKGFVKRMGGKIWLETNEMGGNSFKFTLPIIHINKIEENTLEKKKTKHKKILIVEDENDNFMYINEVMKKLKIETLRAVNGLEAIEIFKENQDFDIIFMDIKMPVMNGFDATKKIRKINSYIPIVALTAFSQENDRIKALEAGCNEYLIKPVRKLSIIKILERFSANTD